MSRKIGRKTVYVGTIVGVLALVAGFAMAAAFQTGTVNSGQNGYSANVVGTIWAGGATGTLLPTLAPGASSNTCNAAPGPVATPYASSFSVTTGTSLTESLYFGMSASGCSANDFAEVWTFTLPQSDLTAKTYVDTFTVSTTWTPSGGTATTAVASDIVSMTVSAGTPGSTTVVLNIVVDYGSSIQPTTISDLNVVVSGD